MREKGWTHASDLAIGAQLRTHDGEWVEVTNRSVSDDIQPVFNLQVDGHHTYFIGDSSKAVLVHNASPSATEPKDSVSVLKSLEALSQKLDESGKKVLLLINGTLSGDIFDKANLKEFNTQVGDHRILITINGVRNDEKDAKKILDSINSWDIPDRLRTAAPNNKHGIGDANQVLNSELGLLGPGIAVVRLVKQIQIAAEALHRVRNDAVEAPEPEIIVIAHSQGTEIADVAFRLLTPETNKMIRFFGNGGQTMVAKNGLRDAVNIRNPGDFVPALKDP